MVMGQLENCQPLSSVLKKHQENGVLIASICTGNFILAHLGIADGLALTCHWASKELVKELFPKQAFDTHKLILDHGNIVSAGGALSGAQLTLYLIQRLVSRELAISTSKIMLVELQFDNQNRFSIFAPPKNHKDDLVLSLQENIENNLCAPLELGVFSTEKGISERHLSRRFKEITGETPLSYLQKIRIEKVKSGLEKGIKDINTLVWGVGYEDVSTFRRLFKQHVGVSMSEYKKRYG
jgi:transcriptional regulator GlxA family with amidase domain